MEDSDRERDRAKYLFLSLLQARVGGSLVSRLGNLAPEAVLETPFSELADWTRTSEKATRAFDELQRGFDPHAVEARLACKGDKNSHPGGRRLPQVAQRCPRPTARPLR